MLDFCFGYHSSTDFSFKSLLVQEKYGAGSALFLDLLSIPRPKLCWISV